MHVMGAAYASAWGLYLGPAEQTQRVGAAMPSSWIHACMSALHAATDPLVLHGGLSIDRLT